jgi:hypothetical protein
MAEGPGDRLAQRHALSQGDKSIREAEYDEASPTGAACDIDSHYIPF